MTDVDINVRGHDMASGILSGIAGGIAALGGGAVLAAIGQGAQQAFQAAAGFERMELSLQSLVAREILHTGQAGSMADAMALAGDKAAELFAWTRQLAINSPFSQQGVADAFKTALTYGFTTDQAKRLTQALIDFASATGSSDAAMNQIALALGQIQAKGKLAGQEILQLVNAGVPVLQILADHFGKSTAEVQKMVEQGLIPADEAIEAITKSMEEDFAGAAKNQSLTLGGLANTFKDLADLGLAELFGGIFGELKPLLADFSTWFQSDGIPLLGEFGANVGSVFGGGIDFVMGLANSMTPLRNILTGLFPPEIRSNISGLFDSFEELGASITGVAPSFQTAFQNIGDTLGTIFGAIGPQVIDNFSTTFSSLAEIITVVGPVIASGIEIIANRIGGALGFVVSVITGLVAGIGQALTGDIQGGLETFGNSILAGFDAITQGFGHVDFSTVMATWDANFKMGGQIISTFAGIVGSAISHAAGSVIGSVGSFIEGGAAIINGLIGAAAGTIGGLASLILGGVNSAIGTVRGGVAGMVSAGVALVQGLIDGVASLIGQLVATIAGAVKKAIAAAFDAAEAQSPSKLTYELGQFIGQGIPVGFLAETPKAISQLAAGTGQMLGAITGEAEGLSLGGSLAPAGAGAGGGSTFITVNVPMQILDDLSSAAPKIFEAVESEKVKRGIQ